MSQYMQDLHKHFQDLGEALYADLKAGEDLVLNYSAEKGIYLRFNGNRVRQNTDVEQVWLSLKFYSNGRNLEKARTLSGNIATDKKMLTVFLQECRSEAQHLPSDPNQVPVVNHGQSHEEFRGTLLAPTDLIRSVATVAEGSDLAGLYFGGTVIQAVSNSKGQNHWFATESFFLDYSLYNGPKASKAVYAEMHWKEEDWKANFARAKEQLALLEKPQQNIKPGKYRTYLAPAAVAELLGMFGWGALSAAAWKQGRSAFKKLADKEVQLSPLFRLQENFALGLSPRFNSLGEVAPECITLIEKGEIQQLLVSSRSEKEYGLKANGAAEGESPRSLDISAGKISEKDILRELGTGLYLSNLHYLNWSDPVSARVTGMTRYACFWVEQGQIVGPIKDLRFDESLFEALGAKLLALTDKPEISPSTSTYGGRALGGSRSPGMLIDDFTFTL